MSKKSTIYRSLHEIFGIAAPLTEIAVRADEWYEMLTHNPPDKLLRRVAEFLAIFAKEVDPRQLNEKELEALVPELTVNDTDVLAILVAFASELVPERG